jgi:hypothetical protein
VHGPFPTGAARAPGPSIADGLHAEPNHSANGLRDVIRMLLGAFEIPRDRLQLFLREDRDAGSEEA